MRSRFVPSSERGAWQQRGGQAASLAFPPGILSTFRENSDKLIEQWWKESKNLTWLPIFPDSFFLPYFAPMKCRVLMNFDEIDSIWHIWLHLSVGNCSLDPGAQALGSVPSDELLFEVFLCLLEFLLCKRRQRQWRQWRKSCRDSQCIQLSTNDKMTLLAPLKTIEHLDARCGWRCFTVLWQPPTTQTPRDTHMNLKNDGGRVNPRSPLGKADLEDKFAECTLCETHG